MSWLLNFTDKIIHLDSYLISIVQQYGILTYPILFIIIFLETGIVITPFLPGDSLLFVAGTISAIGNLNVFFLLILLIFAAIIGDSLNYWIGFHIGKKVFIERKLIHIKYLQKAEIFYEKNGSKTIFLARFIPFIRTFAPFLAGVGKMRYSIFLFYNIFGAIVWVALFLLLGYFFGNIPIVKENLTIFILVIIFFSLIPLIIEFFKKK